jgi:ribonuclease HI
MKATIFIDGAARGNPGPAAFAYIISGAMGSVEHAGALGKATNNVAEYTALVSALRHAAKLGATSVQVFSDSELLVKQMNGAYRVKSPDLRALFSEAQCQARQFERLEIHHIPRSENSHADRLCNELLDREAGLTSRRGSVSARRRGIGSPSNESLDEAVLACLRAAAQSWARGDSANPDPDKVWRELKQIIEGHAQPRRHRPT